MDIWYGNTIIRRYLEKDTLGKGIVCAISNNGIDTVGSSHPGGGEASKGWTVRPLKWFMSWVQTVVRQVGLSLPQALSFEEI